MTPDEAEEIAAQLLSMAAEERKKVPLPGGGQYNPKYDGVIDEALALVDLMK